MVEHWIMLFACFILFFMKRLLFFHEKISITTIIILMVDNVEKTEAYKGYLTMFLTKRDNSMYVLIPKCTIFQDGCTK